MLKLRYVSTFGLIVLMAICFAANDVNAEVGVTDNSIVRVNQQGDIELRRPNGWDVIGGLLGDYEHRLTASTGYRWA